VKIVNTYDLAVGQEASVRGETATLIGRRGALKEKKGKQRTRGNMFLGKTAAGGPSWTLGTDSWNKKIA